MPTHLVHVVDLIVEQVVERARTRVLDVAVPLRLPADEHRLEVHHLRLERNVALRALRQHLYSYGLHSHRLYIHGLCRLCRVCERSASTVMNDDASAITI